MVISVRRMVICYFFERRSSKGRFFRTKKLHGAVEHMEHTPAARTITRNSTLLMPLYAASSVLRSPVSILLPPPSLTSSQTLSSSLPTQQSHWPSRMTIISISSIPRRAALFLCNGSKNRPNRLYSAVYKSSSSPSPSTTAGRQLQSFATEHSIHQFPNSNSIINSTIVNSPAYCGNISSPASRSMVTVTQTSASQKDDETPPSPLIQNDATAPSSTNEELTITSSCAARIRQLASTRPNPDAVYLRLYVDAGGCSGFQYKFLLLSEDNDDGTNSIDNQEEEEDGTIDPEEDIIFVQDGMRVVIDQTSLDLLRGSTIDYVQEMIRSSFAVVGNPQSESACGCGSSFAVKNFESNPALD